MGEREASELSSGLISSLCYHDYRICQPDNCFPDQVTSHLAAGLAGLHPAPEAGYSQMAAQVNCNSTQEVETGSYKLFSNLLSPFFPFHVFLRQGLLWLRLVLNLRLELLFLACTLSSPELGLHA